MVLGMSSPWYLQILKLPDDGELIVPKAPTSCWRRTRDDSSDSRYWGFVPAENIAGRPDDLLVGVCDRLPPPLAVLS